MIGGRIAYELFQDDLAAVALVPSAEILLRVKTLEAQRYEDPALWYSRPGIGVTDPGALAAGLCFPTAACSPPPPIRPAPRAPRSVFFVHPTSYLNPVSNWNVAAGEWRRFREAERIARHIPARHGQPFQCRASEIWAPRYRQATMGAFLTDAPEGQQAIDAAYADVREAFSLFSSPASTPATPTRAGGPFARLAASQTPDCRGCARFAGRGSGWRPLT